MAMMKSVRSEVARVTARWKTIVVTFIVGVIAVLMLAPYAFMAVSAFKPQGEIFASPLKFFPQHYTTSSFDLLFKLLPYARWYLNSFIVAVLGTALTLVISSMAGFAFAKYEFRFKSLLFVLVLGTVLVPFQVLLVPQFRIIRALGEWAELHVSASANDARGKRRDAPAPS